jgi:hypothetical protein
MNRKNFLTGFAAAAVALAVPAFAAPLASGLKPGDQVTPFHPKHLAGPLAGTSNCFPCTFQNRPQVQVWVNGDDPKNVLAVAKTLGGAMKAHKAKEFKALVVVLTTPQNEAAAAKLVQTAAKTPGTEGVGMALLPTTDEAVEAYRVNTSADIKNTVFVYKNWKVADTFVNLKADNGGLAQLGKAIDGVTKS